MMRSSWLGAASMAAMMGAWACVPAGGEAEDTDDASVRDVEVMFGSRDAAPPIPDLGLDMGARDAGRVADEGAANDVGAPDADPSEGDPDCATLAGCLAGCDDIDCSRGCRERAPAESGALYDAIFTCARESGCTEPGGGVDEACMQMNCGEARRACYGEGGPPMPGDLDCGEVRACVAGCGAGDVICTDACEAAATPEAATAYDAVERCRLTSGCPPADVLCFEDACADQIATCEDVVVDPDGDPDCNALAGCVNDCEGDQACADACGAAAPPRAIELYNAAIACLEAAAAQCPEGDQECTQDLCRRQIEACVGQGVTPMGAGTCEDFDACLGECAQGDQPCVDACIVASSQMGFDQYVALVDCVNMSCPAGSGASCGVVNCEPAFEACLGPVPVPRGAETCGQFNDCLGLCAQGDQVCVDRCIERASPAGYDALVAASNCVRDSGCAANDAACQDLNCGAEIDACFFM